MSEAMMWLMGRGIWETVVMTFVSGFFGFVIGLPVGVLLYITRPGQIWEMPSYIAFFPHWLIFSVPFHSLSYWFG